MVSLRSGYKCSMNKNGNNRRQPRGFIWLGRVARHLYQWKATTDRVTFANQIQGATCFWIWQSQAWFLPIHRILSPGDLLEVEFDLKVILRSASPRLRGNKNKIALTRGPLVFCLENVDNPGVYIFVAWLDSSSVADQPARVTFLPALLGGTDIITFKTTGAKDPVFIPYFLIYFENALAKISSDRWPIFLTERILDFNLHK